MVHLMFNKVLTRRLKLHRQKSVIGICQQQKQHNLRLKLKMQMLTEQSAIIQLVSTTLFLNLLFYKGKSLGQGTFGKVRLGTHLITGEKVAIKILEKDKIKDQSDVERVTREIHILKIVRHPNVIQLYEVSILIFYNALIDY